MEQSDTDNDEKFEGLTDFQRIVFKYLKERMPNPKQKIDTLLERDRTLTLKQLLENLNLRTIEDMIYKKTDKFHQTNVVQLSNIYEIDMEYFTSNKFHDKANNHIAKKQRCTPPGIDENDFLYSLIKVRNNVAYFAAKHAYDKA